MGDVVTLPCLLLASYLVGRGIVTPLLGALNLAAAIGALWAGWTERRATTRRVIQESLPVLCVATVLDILAGTVAEPRLESLVAFGAFLILLPGFLGRTGALGSMLAARLGSKLHLGAIAPAGRPEGLALLDGSIVFGQGLLMYLLTGALSLATAEALGRAYPGALRFMGVTMFGGVLAMLVASLIGYYAAVMAYRFGLDPDNHTIPLVNSGMDLVGMICLVVALSVFGVA